MNVTKGLCPSGSLILYQGFQNHCQITFIGKVCKLFLGHTVHYFHYFHQRHYEELHGAKFATQAHKTIAKIIQDEVPNPKRKKRRLFSVEETEQVKSGFPNTFRKMRCLPCLTLTPNPVCRPASQPPGDAARCCSPWRSHLDLNTWRYLVTFTARESAYNKASDVLQSWS